MQTTGRELTTVTPDEWGMLKQQAQAFISSGFLPPAINTPEKAVAILMLGRELGIAPWAALSTINVIQSKPTVSPQLMLALINRSGQLADMECLASASECTVTMVRRGRVPHTETFTMQDAAALQLTGKDNYKKQPATMLKWRAVAACARIVFPDVILGLYTPEEMGADVIADSEGNMTVVAEPSTPITITGETPLQAPQSSQGTAPAQTVQNAPAGNVVQERPTPANDRSAIGQTGNGNGGGSDTFAQKFPPKVPVTYDALYNATHDYFNAPPHFDAHWEKHADVYAVLTLEEAVSYVHQLHWNWDQAVVKQFATYAGDTWDMSVKDVLAALADANGHSVKKFRDWDGGNLTLAYGALLAWMAHNLPAAVRDMGKEKGIADGVIFAAEDICTVYQRKHADKVEA